METFKAATPCICGTFEISVVGEKHNRIVGHCQKCSLLRTANPPENYLSLYTDGTEYHSTSLPGHIAGYRERAEHDYEIAKLRWARLAPKIRLLDVGCANGGFVRRTAELGITVEGLEINPAMADWAAEHTGKEIHKDWTTVWGVFDIITLHDVIEHIPDPVGFLRGLRDYAHEGTLLVLDTPDADDPRRTELGMDWHHMKPIEHLWFFNADSFKRLLDMGGWFLDVLEEPIPGKLVGYARPLSDSKCGGSCNCSC